MSTIQQTAEHEELCKVMADLQILGRHGVTTDHLAQLRRDDELARKVARVFITNMYTDEEVESKYGYFSGYRPNLDQPIDMIIADFERQVNELDNLFNCGKKFDSDFIVRNHALCPKWVEKFFASFDWQYIAPTYGEAVQKVLEALKIARNGECHNYHHGQLGSQYLRQSKRSLKGWQDIKARQQGNDIVACGTQFGIQYRGRSVRRAHVLMDTNEFGLGSFVVGIMLLIHPERLQHHDDLYICCAGDEFAPVANGNWSGAPIFIFDNDRLGFYSYWEGSVESCSGSASAFLIPQ